MRFLIAIMAFGLWSTQVFATDAAKIVVNGVGEIAVVPDLAIVTLGVNHTAMTAEDAMSLINADMSTIMTTLEKAGIAERDIQTSRLQIWPGFRQNANFRFSASNQVTVRVRDVTELGRILGQTISEGVKWFGGWSSGLQFEVSDPAPYEAQARKVAVQNAMAKAKELAEAAGATLGPITEIREIPERGSRGLRIAGSARL